MTMGDWAICIIGVVVVLVTLIDIALSVLHTDINGPIGGNLHRAIWHGAVMITRRLPRFRRGILSLAGPLMMLAMFVVWATLFITGFALIVWPQLDAFRTASGQEAADFVDALYYSGVTATVLGYGDIAPRTDGLKILAFVESGLGFAIFSGVVTWLLNVVSGVSARDALALRVEQETGGTHDGVRLIGRWLPNQASGHAPARLRELTHALQQLQPKMRQFPVLDVHYRSLNAGLAPERMVRSLATASIAGYLRADEHEQPDLEEAASSLDGAVTDLMRLIAAQHLPPKVLKTLIDPEPEAQDEAAVKLLESRVIASGSGRNPLPPQPLLLACRLRVWLDAMDQLTAWRMDGP
ncbi:MAG: ion channel [Phycisphaeraceae bacterium]